MILKKVYKELVQIRKIKKVKRDAREESIMVMSGILKDILMGKYEFTPPFLETKEADKPYYKNMAVRGLMNGMNELERGLNLPNGLKRALVMSESDLERFHYSKLGER